MLKCQILPKSESSVELRMHGMWCNFMKNGDPNVGADLPSDVVWPKYSTDKKEIFYFNGTP